LNEQQQPAKVDSFLHKLLSRKLLVFVVATIAFFAGLINPEIVLISSENWTNIAIMYIGTEGARDFIIALRNNKSPKE